MPTDSTSLLEAVATAYPQGAPPDIKATADRVGELAAQAATLHAAVETLMKAMDRFVAAGGALRAEMVRKSAAQDLTPYDKAYEEDLKAGRERLEARVKEAEACDKALVEACATLAKQLAGK